MPAYLAFYQETRYQSSMNNKKSIFTIILSGFLALCLGITGGVVGAKIMLDKNAPAATVQQGAAIGTSSNVSIELNGDVTIAEAIAEKTMPSVVGISTVFTQTYSGMSGFDFFFGGGGSYSYDATSEGTGFIVDPSGYILTNSHVVSDGAAKSIVVSLYNGEKVDGTVLWNDSTLDLAIVKIEADNLQAVELGDSDTIKIGSYAAVIGNPLGLQFERSMSQGIISGLDRTIQVSSDGSSSGATTMEGLIQTDATINSGNSGGPLLNAKGQVIGINSAKASNGEGMGFAIPINTAKPIVQQIMETGRFERAYLGIAGIGLEEQSQYTTDQLQQQFGTTSGIYVSKVYSGGGADGAGIKQGDIIVSVAGTKVGTMNKINTVLVKYKVGDTVEVGYMRDGKAETCKATLNSQMLMTEQQMQKQ